MLAALLHAPGREHPAPPQDAACPLAGPGLADAPLAKLVCTELCEFNLVTQATMSPPALRADDKPSCNQAPPGLTRARAFRRIKTGLSRI